jgi:hypothetical protein
LTNGHLTYTNSLGNFLKLLILGKSQSHNLGRLAIEAAFLENFVQRGTKRRILAVNLVTKRVAFDGLLIALKSPLLAKEINRQGSTDHERPGQNWSSAIIPMANSMKLQKDLLREVLGLRDAFSPKLAPHPRDMTPVKLLKCSH